MRREVEKKNPACFSLRGGMFVWRGLEEKLLQLVALTNKNEMWGNLHLKCWWLLVVMNRHTRRVLWGPSLFPQSRPNIFFDASRGKIDLAGTWTPLPPASLDQVLPWASHFITRFHEPRRSHHRLQIRIFDTLTDKKLPKVGKLLFRGFIHITKL